MLDTPSLPSSAMRSGDLVGGADQAEEVQAPSTDQPGPFVFVTCVPVCGERVVVRHEGFAHPGVVPVQAPTQIRHCRSGVPKGVVHVLEARKVGADVAERVLLGFARVDDTAYSDVDVGQATTGLPGARFDQLQPPLDMLWMDAEEDDAVGELSGQLAGSRAFHRHVHRQGPSDPLRANASALPLRLFAGGVGPDELDGVAKLLD